ncbi:MAG: hypothetical protein K8J31_28890 [Anaerolineae bacterium]|nr:hypothetical protein [Anaerolineae bacterium]
MRFLNRPSNDNPNLLIGIFLLILLSVFMGPNVLPRLISSISPIIDESIPCDWLRMGFDRANHQSLIGRAATSALDLEVRASNVPASGSGVLSIDVIVINRSLGTVPILYNSTQVNIGDDGTSGLGVIIDPGNLLARSTGRSDAQTYPEQNIRLLGPRQRCIHTIDIPAGQMDPTLLSGNASVRAFYRINSAGTITQAVSIGPTPIYNDQGLDIVPGGFVESLALPLRIEAAAQ